MNIGFSMQRIGRLFTYDGHIKQGWIDRLGEDKGAEHDVFGVCIFGLLAMIGVIFLALAMIQTWTG